MSAVTNHNPASFFGQLQGLWRLHRELQSANAAEPSGKCSGQATFTAREPSVFVDKDGKLQTAIAELLYHEQGEFELYQDMTGSTVSPRFPFSRRYVWRLHEPGDDGSSALSIWFTKPGTDVVDYLFHKVDIESNKLDLQSDLQVGRCIEGNGCHLCEEDFYSSTYTFQLTANHVNHTDTEGVRLQLRNWTMLHEVRGPNKEQHIETKFSRAEPIVDQ